MKSLRALLPFVCLVALPSLIGWAQTDQIDRPRLRAILDELGYGPKDLVTTPGKEKYTITISQGGLDIPVGAEISANGSYIWFTANLGKEPAADKALVLLKRNAETQPTFFYVTKSGVLMIGLPTENRNVTTGLVRQRVDSIVKHVVATQDAWK